jgi:hypothetical protein
MCGTPRGTLDQKRQNQKPDFPKKFHYTTTPAKGKKLLILGVC